MQITINDKVYDTETMTPEAQNLVQHLINANVQTEAYKAAGIAFSSQLQYLLEANQPIDNKETEKNLPDEGPVD